jgi:hypothetical protein
MPAIIKKKPMNTDWGAGSDRYKIAINPKIPTNERYLIIISVIFFIELLN